MPSEEQKVYMDLVSDAFNDDKVKQLLVLVQLDDDYARNNGTIGFAEGENKMIIEFNDSNTQDADDLIDSSLSAIDGHENKYPLLTRIKNKIKGL